MQIVKFKCYKNNLNQCHSSATNNERSSTSSLQRCITRTRYTHSKICKLTWCSDCHCPNIVTSPDDTISHLINFFGMHRRNTLMHTRQWDRILTFKLMATWKIIKISRNYKLKAWQAYSIWHVHKKRLKKSISFSKESKLWF